MSLTIIAIVGATMLLPVQEPPQPPGPGGVAIEILPDKTEYRTVDVLVIRLKMTNKTSSEIQLNSGFSGTEISFGRSGGPYGDQEELHPWPPDRSSLGTFGKGRERNKLAAGKSIYGTFLMFLSESGGRPATPGEWKIKAVFKDSTRRVETYRTVTIKNSDDVPEQIRKFYESDAWKELSCSSLQTGSPAAEKRLKEQGVLEFLRSAPKHGQRGLLALAVALACHHNLEEEGRVGDEFYRMALAEDLPPSLKVLCKVQLAAVYSREHRSEASRLIRELPAEADLDGFVIDEARKLRKKLGLPVPKD